MRVTLVLTVVVCLGASFGRAAPAPRERPPEPDVAAPVAYSDLMLVLVTKDGAAAVIFDSVAAEGNEVEFSFRYESADGKKKLSGTGKLFERRMAQGGYDPAGLAIKAGEVSVQWSRGGTERGWIYYAPEVVTVHLAHAKDFRDRVEKAAPAGEMKYKELDLRRFMKK